MTARRCTYSTLQGGGSREHSHRGGDERHQAKQMWAPAAVHNSGIGVHWRGRPHSSAMAAARWSQPYAALAMLLTTDAHRVHIQLFTELLSVVAKGLWRHEGQLRGAEGRKSGRSCAASLAEAVVPPYRRASWLEVGAGPTPDSCRCSQRATPVHLHPSRESHVSTHRPLALHCGCGAPLLLRNAETKVAQLGAEAAWVMRVGCQQDVVGGPAA